MLRTRLLQKLMKIQWLTEIFPWRSLGNGGSIVVWSFQMVVVCCVTFIGVFRGCMKMLRDWLGLSGLGSW